MTSTTTPIIVTLTGDSALEYARRHYCDDPTCVSVPLGRRIATRDGHGPGPSYGEVYTAAAGQHGFLAGRRTHAARGLGLLDVEWYPTYDEAMEYACRITD